MKAIWKREIRGYFYTPVGYVYMGVFLAISSLLFFLSILRQRSGDLPAFIGEMSYLWMLLCPLLTMRLLAEEKQKQTDQLLFTSPVSVHAIVLGKYFAAITVLFTTAVLTGLYALVVAIYGRVYLSELAVNYLGFLMQGVAFAAMDLFMSACASSPAVAAALAFGANFFVWVLDLIENAVHVEWIAAILRFFGLYSRNEPFLMGQFSFAGLLFDLCFAVVFLLFTISRLNSRYHSDRLIHHGAQIKAARPAILRKLLTFVTAIVLFSLCAGVDVLEKKNGWRRDYSFNAIATQSPETVQILSDLSRPVHIWALFRKGDEDAPLLELLDRYTAASSYISWEQVDPSLNPALISRFSTDMLIPSENSLIVFCEETGRFRVLGPEDFVSLSMDSETGNYTWAGWTYERSITGAIRAVSLDRVPRVVILQGHGELDGETTESFASLLSDNQYDVSFLTLSSGEQLDPSDLIVFFSPLRDLSESEFTILSDFAAHGGSFLFTCDYADPLKDMPRYTSLLRLYGFVPREGIVVADPAASETYYNGMTIYLLPEMCSTDITLDLLASGANTLLLPGTRAFEAPQEGDRNLTTAVVLQSGEGAYLKDLDSQSISLAREENDPAGPFSLALEARRITAEGYLSRAFILGCSAAFTEPQIWSMTDTREFIVRVMEFLLSLDASDLNILARDALRPGLSPNSTSLGSVLVAVLPSLVILAALLILIPRRRK